MLRSVASDSNFHQHPPGLLIEAPPIIQTTPTIYDRHRSPQITRHGGVVYVFGLQNCLFISNKQITFCILGMSIRRHYIQS